MISLILMFAYCKKKDDIIHVLRMPPIKSLRALHLGLTLALILSALTILTQTAYTDFWLIFLWKIIPILVLFYLAFFGGWFVILMFLIFTTVQVLKATEIEFAWLVDVSGAFVVGFLFGAAFATFYNDLIYLHRKLFRKRDIKVSFSFDPKKIFDIVKSPIDDEIRIDDKDEICPYDPVYNYKLDKDTAPKHPYTIVFAANKYVQVLKKKEKTNGEQSNGNGEKDEYEIDIELDPIMNNRDLFFRSVDAALASFESNEVLGRPEIWSRIRVAVFYTEDFGNLPEEECSFVKTFGPPIVQNDKVAEYLLYPQDSWWEDENLEKDTDGEQPDDIKARIERILTEKGERVIFDRIKNEIDVIFALSAHPTHLRSTARYSLYKYQPRGPIGKKSLRYSYWENPSTIDLPTQIRPLDIFNSLSFYPPFNDTHNHHYHEPFADHPGLVALNILGATSKTYIHEFGHAMSATGTGIIVDEFYDDLPEISDIQESNPKDDEDLYTPAFYVNRLERQKQTASTSCNILPIPREFCKYQGQWYYTDLEHPSAEENWIGYFPKRQEGTDGCIMDRTFGSYAFDKLLQKFIYDRLMVKINRTKG